MYRKSVTETKIDVLNLSLYIHKQNINFKNLNKIKKMIFSAVALVAFSVSGMANEIEEKKVENVETTSTGCHNVHLDTYQSAIDNGANETQAGKVAWDAYKSCTEKVLTQA